MQSDSYEITIIVPVYNGERYINQCIRSIQQQTYTCWQLLILDDGSTDRTGEICEIAAKRDGRIRVVHQNNMGLLRTRVRALTFVQTPYVTFVDADDLIFPCFVEIMLEVQKKNKADIVCCGFQTLSRHGLLRGYASKSGKETLLDGRTYAPKFFCRGDINASVWGKVYRTALWTQDLLEFDTLPNVFWGEDTIFNAIIFNRADVVVTKDICLYQYRVGGGSFMGADKTMRELDELYCWRKKFLQMNNADIYIGEALSHILFAAVYYSHFSKPLRTRREICEALPHVVEDMRKMKPDFQFFNAFNLDYVMSDKDFHHLYKENKWIRLKQLIMRYL